MKTILTITFAILTQVVFAQKNLTKLWQSDTTLRSPESVCIDAKNKVLYVSNTVSFNEKGTSFISKLDMNGKFISREWIKGLNAVLGLGMYKDRLYAAEANSKELVVINIKTAEVIKRIPVEGAVLLNDITIDEKGIVYVSDTRTGKVIRIENDQPAVYLENLKGVNGLLAVGKMLYILSDGALIKADENKNTEVISKGMEGGLDGVAQVNDKEFLVSGWQGLVYYVNADGSNQVLLDTRAEKISAADINYNKTSKTLYVPTVRSNSIVAYQVK
ncbi:ATP-binding protein [Pedobacter aquatilis]|uniref:ATP-binding protein n=1 Tax=Pedobacter aquatilis TaxID=351343 RepID=UPI002930AF96|nr:ATP-binding protein [Pedobacter aquatilis]